MKGAALVRRAYDGVVACVPVTVPYRRFSTNSAHWWIGRALRALALYLTQFPAAPNHAQVRALIAEIEEEQRRRAPPKPLVPTTPVDQEPATRAGLAIGQPSAETRRSPRPWHRRWYVWAAVAVVIVGATSGGAIAATRGAAPPMPTLGGRVLMPNFMGGP